MNLKELNVQELSIENLILINGGSKGKILRKIAKWVGLNYLWDEITGGISDGINAEC